MAGKQVSYDGDFKKGGIYQLQGNVGIFRTVRPFSRGDTTENGEKE
jgi:hypothetical protein